MHGPPDSHPPRVLPSQSSAAPPFNYRYPNGQTFSQLSTNIRHCHKCQVTSPVFRHPYKCPMCQHVWCDRCPSLTDDYYNFQGYDPEDLLTFPPRDDPLPENSADTSRPLPLGPESPKADAGMSSTLSRFEFAELTERFDYAAAMDNINLGYSSDVIIPRGWQIQSSIIPTIKEYFDIKDEFDKGFEVLTHNATHKSGEQVWFGFKPQELISSGAIQSLDPRRNDLEIPIHPLLQRDNWHNTPDEIYKFLEPALRLASCFLREPLACQWWCTWRYGHREVDMRKTSEDGEPVQYITKAVENSEATSLMAIEHLYDLGKYTAPGEGRLLSIRWFGDTTVWDGEEEIENRKACGYTSAKLLSRHPFPDGHQFLRAGISMNRDFYIAADRFMNTQNPDPDVILRFNFFFMVTLVHELCHALGIMDQYRNKTRPWYIPEVEFEGRTENGYQWEQLTFGGILAPVNNDFSIKYGMSMYAFEDRYKGWNDPSRKFFTIPMSYMEKIQQQSFWDTLDDKRSSLTTDQRWKFFHIDKRFAAKAWGQPYVCMADPAEADVERWDKFLAEKDSRLKREAYNRMTQEQKDNVRRIAEAQEIEELRMQRRKAWQLRQKLAAERKMNRHREVSDRDYRLRLFETIQEPAEPLQRRPGRESGREIDARRGRSRSPRRSPPNPPPPPAENLETETEQERARREYEWEKYRRRQKRQRDQVFVSRQTTLEGIRQAQKEASQQNEYRDLVTGEIIERPLEPPPARGMWQPHRDNQRDRDMDAVSDMLEAWLLPRDILTRKQQEIEAIVVSEEYDEYTTSEESGSPTDTGSDVTMTAPDPAPASTGIVRPGLHDGFYTTPNLSQGVTDEELLGGP